MSDFNYLCRECCQRANLYFAGWAENRAGRKACDCCGDNTPWQLDTADAEKFAKAKEAYSE